MKKTLLSICILLFAAITLYAQKFELGFNAGVQRNTHLRSKAEYSPLHAIPVTSYQPALSLKGIYNRNNWQLGLSVDYRKLNFSFHDFYTIPYDPGFSGHLVQSGRLSSMPVSIFANKKVCFKKLELYGGASVGYAFTWVDQRKPGFEYSHVEPLLDNGRYRGFCGGVQCGGNYRVSNRIAINAEVGANYIHFKQDKFDPSYTFSIPATLGFRYRLKPDTNKLRTN